MPRIGMGIPIAYTGSTNPHLAVDDFTFLNDVSGELTPNNTATRKNLLLQSQTFKTTWTTNNAVIPNDLYEAPNNSLTAQAITASSAGASSVFVQQIVATTSGETYTYSLHAKKDSTGFVSLQFGDGTTTRKAWFNLSTGAVNNTSNILTSSFDKMDDDWFRVSITFQANATTSSSFVRIFAASVAGSTSTGASFQAGTELLYIWGAQLEEDSRPSSYIVTTNAAVNVATTLNDLSEMFDFDGTDIMLEASLDKNEGAFEEATQNLVLNHDYEELGSELVTNRDFASDTIWTKGSGWTIGSGVATCDGTNSALLFQSLANTTTNDTFKVTYTISNYVSGSVFVGLGSGLVQPSGTTRNANGTYTQYLTKTSTSTSFGFKSISFVGSIDNVLVKQVDPNDRWSLTGGTSISDGKMTVTGASGTSLGFQSVLVQGTAYELTYTISNFSSSSGNTDIINNDGATIQSISSNGTFTVIFTHSIASGNLIFRASSGTNSYQVDNVFVKEYAIKPLNV